MAADLAIALLIGAGYVVAAGTIAVGLIALVTWLFVLPGRAIEGSRSAWWADVALAVLLLALFAALSTWLTGCAVAVAYHRADAPAAHARSSSPDAGPPTDERLTPDSAP